MAAIAFATASFVETAVAQTAPTITSGSTTTFVFGRVSFFTVTTTGAPTPSITETGALPTGVTFNDNGNGTATLQGTPSGTGGIGGIYSLTITASNGVSPNASQAFRLVVDQAPSITSAVSTTFRIGVSGNFTVTTSGFSASSSTTLSFSGTLPTGISFLDNGNGTATLGGTPAAGTAGNYPITIFANNGVVPSAEQAFTLTVSQAGTTTLLSSSQNPSSFGQPVTFTATVAGSSPTGTVTFLDGVTQIGTATLSGGTASFTTSSLAVGSHSITAKYSGDTNNSAGTSAALTQTVGIAADSIKLRAMQISTTPIVANISGQAITGAIDNAIDVGFSGNPGPLTPNGSGFTYYFDADPDAQRNITEQDDVNSFLASPNGSSGSGRRIADDFSALGYAGPVKAPQVSTVPAHDWLAWIDVRGTDFDRNTFGSDLKGEQINAIAGLTRRLTPDFLVGVLGGYEHFDYSSQALSGVLTGDGWTTGAYLGWRFAPHLRFDAGGAWSDILANDAAGTAVGNFTGNRWLTFGGVTGTYDWRAFVLEPSARVYALWEHENAYTDSLGTLQADRNFATGRGSGGVKVSYPVAWSSTVNLVPYAGLYGDYYFSRDDAIDTGLTTVPLLQGWSARATGGLSMTFVRGAQLSAGGEYGGIGGNTHIWTWRMSGSVPF